MAERKVEGKPQRGSMLETYYQIRKSGEFPTSLSVSGALIGGLFLSRACSAVFGEGVGLLSMVSLTLAGGAIGYWYDRRSSRRRMQEFVESNPEINILLSNSQATPIPHVPKPPVV